MKTMVAVAERVSYMVIGTALFIIGLVFAVLGVTLFPVIGILIAFPMICLGIKFFTLDTSATLEESCREPAMIAETTNEESVAA
jgi:hypothetical protein